MGVVLAGTTIAADGGPAAQAGSECPVPKEVTRFHERDVFRGAMESFRRELEAERGALEARRRQLAPGEYSEGLAAYRRGVAAYGEAMARSRSCPRAPSAILTMDVRPAPSDSADDRLLLTVRYYYTGERGAAVSIGAITMLDSASTGHWAYRPVRLARGLHTATVGLGMNRSAPDRYRSDAVLVKMYEHRGPDFHARLFPLAREWTRGR